MPTATSRPHRFPLLLGLALLCACGAEDVPDPAAAPADDGPLDVFAVHHPLATMARRIGGPLVSVGFPAEGAGDPAFWTPTDEQLQRFQRADLVLLNGAGYSKWVQTAPLPASRLVDTTAGRRDDLIEVEGEVTHAHGPAGDHSHAGTAFTTWLDLDLAADQARAVRRALERARPEEAARFEVATTRLLAELTLLDERLAACVDDRPVIGSHPVYQYLARRYDLDLRAVHWEPDVEPDAGQWAELDALLAEHPAALMIWEGEPLPTVVAALGERGLESVVFSPCSQPPAEGDWLDELARGVAALCGAYGG